MLTNVDLLTVTQCELTTLILLKSVMRSAA